MEQPHVGLPNLWELDGRIDAQLDGLIEAGECGWECCREGLLSQEPGECFAASLLALHSGQSSRMNEVVIATHGNDDLVKSIALAIAWKRWSMLTAEWMQAAGWQSSVSLATLLIHGRDPGSGLAADLEDASPVVRRIALRGAGELGRTDLFDQVATHIADSDGESAWWAAWSLAMLGGAKQDIERLMAIVLQRPNSAAWALPVIVDRCDPALTCSWYQELARTGHDRLAIAIAAQMGLRETVPWLLEKMSDLSTARIAAEAFTTITALRIQGGSWEVPSPEWVDSGPTDEPEDEGVAMDSDEYLSWPNVSAVADWWSAHEDAFADGASYLLGRPRTADWLWAVMRGGMQRERFQAALNLVLKSPGRKLFNVRAPCELQCAWLRASPAD